MPRSRCKEGTTPECCTQVLTDWATTEIKKKKQRNRDFSHWGSLSAYREISNYSLTSTTIKLLIDDTEHDLL